MDEVTIPAHLSFEELAKLLIVWSEIVADHTALVEGAKADLHAAIVSHRRAVAHLARLRDRCYQMDEDAVRLEA